MFRTLPPLIPATKPVAMTARRISVIEKRDNGLLACWGSSQAGALISTMTLGKSELERRLA